MLKTILGLILCYTFSLCHAKIYNLTGQVGEYLKFNCKIKQGSKHSKNEFEISHSENFNKIEKINNIDNINKLEVTYNFNPDKNLRCNLNNKKEKEVYIENIKNEIYAYNQKKLKNRHF